MAEFAALQRDCGFMPIGSKWTAEQSLCACEPWVGCRLYEKLKIQTIRIAFLFTCAYRLVPSGALAFGMAQSTTKSTTEKLGKEEGDVTTNNTSRKRQVLI